MALAAIVSPSVELGNQCSPADIRTHIAVAGRSTWVTVHADLKATAATSTVLKTPMTNASANAHLVRVPPRAVRMLLRARYAIGVTALTTQPTVKVFSIFGETPYTGTAAAPVLINDGTVPTMRIDASTQNASATGLTMAPTTDLLDAAYGYSDPIDMTGFDAKNAHYVMVLVAQAAVINTGSGAIDLQALFLN